MSENGGSDLDVFENLSKAPAPARKKTLVGMAAPSSPGLGSADRASLPPPPPPSLRTSVPPPPPPSRLSHPAIDEAVLAAAAEAEEIDDVDALDEDSSPLATGPDELTAPDETAEITEANEVTKADSLWEDDAAPAEPVSPGLYADDDATQVFSTMDSSADALTEEPPTPIAALGSSPVANPLPALSSTPSGRPLPPPPSVFRSSGPPPPPPTPSRPQAAPSATEWDDDEDKTSVFSRESGFDAAHMLMGTSQVGAVPVGGLPDVPPPPMSRPSAPIPSPPVRSMPVPAPYTSMSPGSVPPVASNRTPLLLGALAAVALGLALFFILRPSTGGLVVTVAGPGSEPITGVEVLVDGKVACTASPCTLEDLPAGTHMVQARADGYAQTAEAAVLVTSGQDAVQNIRLAKTSGTGVRVSGMGAGLKLYVDGEDQGPLPVELKKLSPGKHELEVRGEQFERWQKSINVSENEMQNIEVPPLKVIKGLAIIKAGDGADGARIVLEADGDRRVLPSLPMNLHIDTSKPHRLVATKGGHETFREDLVFPPGQAERTFEIELRPVEPSDVAPPVHHAQPRAPVERPSNPEPAGGQATLNINSIPASNILLDGRPIGMTPKRGVTVSAGPHTVVFIHNDQRASKSVKAVAGQSATVVHRFK